MPVVHTSHRRTARGLASVLGLTLLMLAVMGPSVGAANAKTKRMTVGSSGTQVANGGQDPAISAPGRHVAFFSFSNDLVAGDSNGVGDIFVRNHKFGKTRRVNVRSDGDEAEGGVSRHPVISADGRYVAFESSATNLVNFDTNGRSDVFVHDRRSGKTRRMSIRTNGDQAFGGDSRSASISADGRYVAFWSSATNLVNSDTNGTTDVFVRDRKMRRTRRVSVRSNGDQADGGSSAPAISANGRFVAFQSNATNLAKGDTNGVVDIFIHDRKTGKTRRLSIHSNGTQATVNSLAPAISGNGRFVAFQSLDVGLVQGDTNDRRDVFVRDRKTGKTRRVSLRSSGKQANGSSEEATISGDGRYVAFASRATNLVKSDTNDVIDIFVHDRWTGRTRRASVRSNGDQGIEGDSAEPALSANGRFVAFWSDAINLVKADTNAATDVFRRGPLR